MGVRLAKVGDLADVMAIARQGFRRHQDRFGPEWLLDRLSEAGTKLWVDDAGAGLVRGFVLLERYETGTSVRLIAVGPEFRRQGVGRRLLTKVVWPASAWVRSENDASAALFTSAGWTVEIASKRRRGDWTYFVLPRPDAG